MKNLMQEKFQVTAKGKIEDGEGWATFESTRRTTNPEKDWIVAHKPGAGSHITPDYKFNYLPPGMDITNQRNTEQNQMPLSVAGQTDVTNTVGDANVQRGWLRKDMSPVDDMYTNEHVEEFYGEAKGEDDSGDKYTGFLERNNYLDRT